MMRLTNYLCVRGPGGACGSADEQCVREGTVWSMWEWPCRTGRAGDRRASGGMRTPYGESSEEDLKVCAGFDGQSRMSDGSGAR